MNLANGLDTRMNTDTQIVVLSPPVSRNPLLDDLIDRGVIPAEDWQRADMDAKRPIVDARNKEDLLARLQEARWLTPFQASQIRSAGATTLVLGNYRLLDEIGAGGMGVVYRGEHRLLRRPVAIKVLRSFADTDDVLLQRFFVEMRALARIRHPNIVWALDAGTMKSQKLEEPHRHYLVMEYVSGENLEALVAKGPLPIALACELIHQIAAALDETHKLNLIHRDIKPSNILVTAEGKAKLLDFGLALHFGQRRLTRPGTVLGTMGYMAPEQVGDAASVDIRADIFGLGATLYFCLTGTSPFPTHGPVAHQATSRLIPKIPEVCKCRPDVSPELETVIRRMMAHNAEDRYATPQSLLRALLPFVNASYRFAPPRQQAAETACVDSGRAPSARSVDLPRILVVDDQPGIRQLCRSYFRLEGFPCCEASDGTEALRLLAERPFDLVLLDIDMPGISGAETLERLRRNLPCGYLKVIMMSGGVRSDEMAAMLALGADDYLAKPFTRTQLIARSRAALAHKAIQDRTDSLNQQLLNVNSELERSLAARAHDLRQIRQALLFALAKIVSSRTRETPGHMARMARYSTTLARKARSIAHLGAVLDDAFVQTLAGCAPLHDIGNVALPDHLLQRNTPLNAEDLVVMQAHTTIGADTLTSVAKVDRSAAGYWQMAIDISRHHHERHDGAGYPDRLAGRDIPIAARLVALADAYETLRASDERGSGLSHQAAVQAIVQGSKGRFDPTLVQAFQQVEVEFDEVFRGVPEGACEI